MIQWADGMVPETPLGQGFSSIHTKLSGAGGGVLKKGRDHFPVAVEKKHHCRQELELQNGIVHPTFLPLSPSPALHPKKEVSSWRVPSRAVASAWSRLPPAKRVAGACGVSAGGFSSGPNY